MRNKFLSDSFAVTIVKFFTLATGLLCTMILSRALPLTEYGTFSAGNLIINIGTTCSAFGLIDAINFYYNGRKEKDRGEYVNTIFGLIILCGIVIALFIVSAREWITEYFHNNSLAVVYVYIAFRPLISNLASAIQILHVSIGKAKTVAIRSALMAIAKLAIVVVVSLTTKKTSIIFLMLLIMEAASLICFYLSIRRCKVQISPIRINISKVNEILMFCVPMGLYIQMNSLTRDIDKYVIGYFESTETLAIYANCSALLPFDIISAALMSIMLPALTRCIRNGKFEAGCLMFKTYLKIGYVFTWIFTTLCLALPEEAVIFLYGDKYLIGVPIFLIYIIADMMKFANMSVVLSANGRTKTLMIISIGSLLTKAGLSVAFNFVFGWIGPAVASVIVSIMTTLVLMKCNLRVLHAKVSSFLDWKHLGKYALSLALGYILLKLLRKICLGVGLNALLTLFVLGVGFAAVIVAINAKDIKCTFRIMNKTVNN